MNATWDNTIRSSSKIGIGIGVAIPIGFVIDYVKIYTEPKLIRSVAAMIPSFLIPACFWDCDPKEIDLRLHLRFVIERVMEYGDDNAIRWLLRTYTNGDLIDVLHRSSVLTAKTVTCWTNYLGVS